MYCLRYPPRALWLIKWSAIDLRSKAREMKEALRKLSRCNRRFRPGQSVLEARMYPTTGCFKREGTISSLAIYSSRKTNSRPFLPLSFYDTSIARFVWWSVNGHCQLVYWFWTYKWSVTDRRKTYKWYANMWHCVLGCVITYQISATDLIFVE